MNPFLRFDEMLTPKIIQILFIVGAAMATLSGLTIVLAGFGAMTQNSLVGFGIAVLGLLAIVAGILIVRICCELSIVLFKIHECLVEIRNDGSPRL